MKNHKKSGQFGAAKTAAALLLFMAPVVIIFIFGAPQAATARQGVTNPGYRWINTGKTYRFSKPGAVAGLRPSHLSGRGQETGPSAILTGSLNLYGKTALLQTGPATALIRGKVSLQTSNEANIVTIAPAGGQKILANPDGTFEVMVANHAPYHLTISAPGYLRAEVNGTAPAGGTAINLAGITLLHGDVTGNNLIDIFDLAFFGNYFFSGNFLADGNRDSLVDIVDVTTAATNYGERGQRLNDIETRLQQLTQQLGLSPLQAGQKPDPAKVELGRALYFDKELSGNRDIACATCHLPSEGTGDALPVSIGVGGSSTGAHRALGAGRSFIPRNAPDVFNRGAEEWHTMFWDNRVSGNAADGFITPAGARLPGGVENVLAAQAMFPVTSRDEMRGSAGDLDVFGQPNEVAAVPDKDLAAIWSTLMERLRANPEYAQLFTAAYPDVTPEALGFQHAANAIAAFEIDAFTFTNSPWDRFLAGETAALSPDAKAGALLFFGKANCSNCHAGNLFTDQLPHNICAPQVGPGKGDAAPQDFGRAGETSLEEDMFAFRTPPLRNVSLSGPWTHAGAYNLLEAVVRHHLNPKLALRNYDTSQLRPDLQAAFQRDEAAINAMLQNIDPLLGAPQTLTDKQVGQLVTFLESLTDPAAADMSGVAPAAVPSRLLIDQ